MRRVILILILISEILPLSACIKREHIPFEKYNIDHKISVSGDAAYSEYFQTIRKKIYHYVYLKYSGLYTGIVNLRFKVKHNGKILDIKVNKDETKASGMLIGETIKALKKTSPLPPFPEGLNKHEYLIFKVELIFEIEDSAKEGEKNQDRF